MFKKTFLVTIFALTALTSFSFPKIANADLFGYNAIDEANGCKPRDRYLPTLLICGRNKDADTCDKFKQQCTLGDLVETGSRVLVWLISVVILVVPILVMYYGAQIIINQQLDGNISKIKELRGKLFNILIYFILLLGAWLIVRTVVDIFQVEDRVPSFLIDENGQEVKARNFNTGF